MKCKNSWSVTSSEFAMNSINPIRQIVENMKVDPNPDKTFIPLSIGKLFARKLYLSVSTVFRARSHFCLPLRFFAGDPTLFGNLQPTDQIVDALVKSITSAKYNGYLPSTGLESAREAVARYVSVPGAEINGKVKDAFYCIDYIYQSR